MPIRSSFTSLTTMFQTSNLICQSVNLTDDIKIGLQYDIQHGLLNIFVKDIGTNAQLPSQIHIHSNQSKDFDLISEKDEYLLHTSETQQNQITDVIYCQEEDEPKICIELSNIYVYDIDEEEEEEDDDENEHNYCERMITSSSSCIYLSSISSSSSCFDDQTIDNDDGYSTHSLDDTEQQQQQQQQQQSLSIIPSKFLIPAVSYQHKDNYYSKEYSSSIHRLIEELLWLNPFRKPIKQMIRFNHFFH